MNLTQKVIKRINLVKIGNFVRKISKKLIFGAKIT